MSTKEWHDVSYGRARIIDIDSHRNGVSGAPFVVALVDFINEDGVGQRFLVQSMRPDSLDVSTDQQERTFAEQTTAIDVERLAEGIKFGENSWRGADMFGRLMVDAYREHCLNDRGYDPFIDDSEA